MKSHPYADLFPMMDDAALEALAEDIKENGLNRCIVRYQGKILDGRNRHAACQRAEVATRFEDFEGDDDAALALVLSENSSRRDMTPGQRAMVAAELWLEYGQKGRGRPKKGEKTNNVSFSLSQLSKRFRIGEQYILQAADIITEAPILAGEVKAGTKHLAPAYAELEAQRKEAAERQRKKKAIGQYLAAVEAGEMTLEEAFDKALEDAKEEKAKQEAQADACRQWLKNLSQAVTWTRSLVAPLSDEQIAWSLNKETPGWFEHGIATDALSEASKQIDRIRRIFSKGV